MDNTRPKVSPDTDYRYVDKWGGRELTFRPKPDEAMVTFQGLAEEGDSARSLRTRSSCR